MDVQEEEEGETDEGLEGDWSVLPVPEYCGDFMLVDE